MRNRGTESCQQPRVSLDPPGGACAWATVPADARVQPCETLRQKPLPVLAGSPTPRNGDNRSVVLPRAGTTGRRLVLCTVSSLVQGPEKAGGAWGLDRMGVCPAFQVQLPGSCSGKLLEEEKWCREVDKRQEGGEEAPGVPPSPPSHGRGPCALFWPPSADPPGSPWGPDSHRKVLLHLYCRAPRLPPPGSLPSEAAVGAYCTNPQLSCSSPMTFVPQTLMFKKYLLL